MKNKDTKKNPRLVSRKIRSMHSLAVHKERLPPKKPKSIISPRVLPTIPRYSIALLYTFLIRSVATGLSLAVSPFLNLLTMPDIPPFGLSSSVLFSAIIIFFISPVEVYFKLSFSIAYLFSVCLDTTYIRRLRGLNCT